MFGRRDPREEGELVYHTWTAWIKRTKPRYYPLPGQTTSVIGPEVSFIWNGQLLRVPKHDRVPVIPNRRMLVPVDPFVYEPLDENERRLGHPASTADGGDEANTTIVYSPPHFYRRVIAMVTIVWLVSTFALCASVVVPLLLGRAIFKHKLGVKQNVHDIYSYSLGASILLLVSSMLTSTVKIIIDVNRQRTARSKLKKLTRYAHRCLYKVNNRRKKETCLIYLCLGISMGLLFSFIWTNRAFCSGRSHGVLFYYSHKQYKKVSS